MEQKFPVLVLAIMLIIISSVSARLEVGGVPIISTVILTSDNEADLVVSHILADRIIASIVITHWGTFNGTAFTKIFSIKPSRVMIVGGHEAIPKSAEETLEKLGIACIRYNGKDRYETAALVAIEWRNVAKIIIAEGNDEEGIREAEVIAKAQRVPIVYIKFEGIPAVTINVTTKLGATTVILISTPGISVEEIKTKLRVKMVNETFKKNFKERAAHAIAEAREEIKEVNQTIAESNIKDLNVTAAEILLMNARNHLANSEKVFNEAKFGEAFGNALVAQRNAEDAKRILEQRIKLDEEEEENFEADAATKIIVKAAGEISELREDIAKAQKIGIDVYNEIQMLDDATALLTQAEKALAIGNEDEAKDLAIAAWEFAFDAKSSIEAQLEEI
ncbi:MAG: hypothetical protein HY929_08860 [Euryarchaeota archaeon]|nr:hypothetical protein [Euryarchaeota archaeon]